MQKFILVSAIFSCSFVYADTAKLVCSTGDYSTVAAATENLNASLKKLTVKSASAPVLTTDRLGFISVCVTITQ